MQSSNDLCGLYTIRVCLQKQIMRSANVYEVPFQAGKNRNLLLRWK
jgi:hypothetical protein